MSDEEGSNGKVNMAMVVGELKGLVSGLQGTLIQQNIDSAKYRVEQATVANENRKEFMGVFEKINTNIEKQSDMLQKNSDTLIELSAWKTDVHPKIKILWDGNSSQKGFLTAVGMIGGAVGAAIMVGIEWYKK